MADVNRKPNENSVHHVHTHVCPKCERPYSCNCHTQTDDISLICIDCERQGK